MEDVNLGGYNDSRHHVANLILKAEFGGTFSQTEARSFLWRLYPEFAAVADLQYREKWLACQVVLSDLLPWIEKAGNHESANQIRSVLENESDQM